MNEIAQVLESQIRYHNYKYWVLEKPEISDYQYDLLEEKLRTINPDSLALVKLPAIIPNDPIAHKTPMLSLGKFYEVDQIRKWMENTGADKFICTPKMDGIALSARWNKYGFLQVAATRGGDGTVGENVTKNVARIANIPNSEKIDFAIDVRGEVYVTKERFQELYNTADDNDKPCSSRNTASGALRRKSASESAKTGILFKVYDVLDYSNDDIVKFEYMHQRLDFLSFIGFDTVSYSVYDIKNNLESFISNLVDKRESLEYEIDGLVFRVDNIAHGDELGFTGHHPKHSKAFKFKAAQKQTTLLGVEWNISRTGICTPVAVFKPVELAGAVLTRASLSHAGMIERLGVTNNCEIIVSRAGEVIPHVDYVVKKGNSDELIGLPTVCPSCNTGLVQELTKIEVNEQIVEVLVLKCNGENCRDQNVGQIAHFVKTLGIEGFGRKIIQSMFDCGMTRKPIDLYDLEVNSLENLNLNLNGEKPRLLGNKTAVKLVSEIKKCFTVYVDMFLISLGIPMLGRKASKVLSENFRDLDVIRKVTTDELMKIDGIGPEIATAITDGLEKESDYIDLFLEKIEVHRKSQEQDRKEIVFTGRMNNKRLELEKMAYTYGFLANKSVSKQTDILVCNPLNGAKSSKQKKAEKFGIKVVSEQDFLDMINGV